MNGSLPTRIAGLVTGIATAIVIAAVAIVPFLTPAWVSFEQARADAAAWTGFTPAELRTATDAILADLVIGPPDFDVEVRGAAVLTERERAHMRDVRGVFGLFGLVAVASAVVVVAAHAGARRLGHAERAWLAIRNGARALIVAVVVAGAVAAVAFDVAFEVFHRLFFASGSYTFDPANDRLVQLFPFRFWSETTMVLGAVMLVLAVIVGVVAGRRAAIVGATSDPSPRAARGDTTRTAGPPAGSEAVR